VRTVHLHGGHRGCRSGPGHSFPRAAEENNDGGGRHEGLVTAVSATPDVNAPAVPTAQRRRHRSGFGAVAFAFLIVMAVATLPSPLYGLYRTRDHLSVLTITVVFAIFAGSTIAVLQRDSSITARIGRRGTMLVAVATMMIAVGVLAAWKDLPGLLIGRLVTGVSVGLAAGTAITYLIELRLRADPKASPVRARTIGTAVTIGALAVGPLIAGCLAQWVTQPLTVPYLVFIALGAIALIGLWAAPETGPLATEKKPAGSRPKVRLPVPAAAGTLAAFPRMACSQGCPDSSSPPRCTIPRTHSPVLRSSFFLPAEWYPSWQRCRHRACSHSERFPCLRVWRCSLFPCAFPHQIWRCS
jgi:MFS family permease